MVKLNQLILFPNAILELGNKLYLESLYPYMTHVPSSIIMTIIKTCQPYYCEGHTMHCIVCTVSAYSHDEILTKLGKQYCRPCGDALIRHRVHPSIAL